MRLPSAAIATTMAEDGPSTTAASPLQAKQDASTPPPLDVAVVRHALGWKQTGLSDTALGRFAKAAFDAGRSKTGIATADMPYEVTLLLSDDAEVQTLNRQWRGFDKPTNVLSFPADEALDGSALAAFEQPIPLGDVVLSLETLQREADAQAVPLADHAGHLVVHGMLHLLGFDHETEPEAAEMEALETEILKSLGIADPYREPPEPEAGGAKR